MHDLNDVVSPSLLTAPPNTPKFPTAQGFGGSKSKSQQSFRNRDHLVYLEMMAAKEHFDKALFSMKMNIADELGNLHGPAMDLSSHKIFEEECPSPGASGMSPATFKRRSSLGSFSSKLMNCSRLLDSVTHILIICRH